MNQLMTAQIQYSPRGYAQCHYPVIRRTDSTVTVNIGTDSRPMAYTTRAYRVTNEGAFFAPQASNVRSVDADTDKGTKTQIDVVEAPQEASTVTVTETQLRVWEEVAESINPFEWNGIGFLGELKASVPALIAEVRRLQGELQTSQTQLLWREKQLLALGHEVNVGDCEVASYRDQFLCESNAQNAQLRERWQKAKADNERLQTELAALRRERVQNLHELTDHVTEAGDMVFNVGDRVRVIPNIDSLKAGMLGVVISIDLACPRSMPYCVTLDDTSYSWFRESELEPLTGYRAVQGKSELDALMELFDHPAADYTAYVEQSKADHVTPLSYADWQRQHTPDDWQGFEFHTPEPSTPVKFFDGVSDLGSVL